MKNDKENISKENALQKVRSILDDLKNIGNDIEELFNHGYITAGHYEDLLDTLDDMISIFKEILEEIKSAE
ncbi:MAG: hypothetical protein ACP5GU_02325 [Thermoprotei archaeon]|jgi:hypothetical protein